MDTERKSPMKRIITICQESERMVEEYRESGLVQEWGIARSLYAYANGVKMLLYLDVCAVPIDTNNLILQNFISKELGLEDGKLRNKIDSKILENNKIKSKWQKHSNRVLADYYAGLAEWSYNADFGNEAKLRLLLKRFGDLLLEIHNELIKREVL